MLDYKRDIKIDEGALEQEWLKQPSLMAAYGTYVAECRYEMDTAKDYIEYVRGKLDRSIRKNPSKFGVEKFTEGAATSAIAVNEEYREALSAYNTAKYEHEAAKAAVDAMEQRKSALENLVRLYGQQYFAGPSMPRDIVAESNKRRQADADANRAVGQAMKRNKKGHE